MLAEKYGKYTYMLIWDKKCGKLPKCYNSQFKELLFSIVRHAVETWDLLNKSIEIRHDTNNQTALVTTILRNLGWKLIWD